MNFDEAFLIEMGLGAMPEEKKSSFLDYLQNEAERRVGEKITEGMSDEKIDEFDECETDEQALAWLERNRPDFRDVVDGVLNDVKQSVIRNRERLLQGA